MNTPTMVCTTDLIVRTTTMMSMTVNIIAVVLLLFVAVTTKVIASVVVSAGGKRPTKNAWRTPWDVACMPKLPLLGVLSQARKKNCAYHASRF